MRLSLLLLSLALTCSSPYATQNSFSKSSELQAKSATASFTRRTSLPKWAQTLADIPVTQSEEPVVMRLNESQAWVSTTSAYLINRAIQVNDQSAIGAIGQFGISYFPSYQQLNLHRVALLRGNKTIDQTATVNTRLLQRETSMENGTYGGATTVQLLLDDVRVGDTLWITYSVEGENPVFGKNWASEFQWDSTSPIELRRVTVLHPRNRHIQWRQLGEFRTAEIKPQIDQIGEITRLRFEEKSIEALENEPAIPKSYIPGRILQFTEYSNWQGVAEWADNLFPKLGKSPELKKLASQFSQKPTPLAKASAALQWVQNEVRYFSVSIGENSHRPQNPEAVIKKRYGDCKDKSYLLVSLLSDMGIEAHPVLLSAQGPQIPTKMLASPIAFDHVIVQIKIADQLYYVDPTRTHQTAAIDKLQTALPGAAGLLVNASSKELITLPLRTDNQVQYEHIESIKLHSFDGDASLETREIYRGSYAEWARQRFPSMSKSEFKKYFLAMYEKLYPGITIQKNPSFQDFPDENRFEITIAYILPKPVTPKDGKYALDYDSQIIYGSLGIPEKIIRNYPLELSSDQFHGRYRLNLTWPKTVRENEAPSIKKMDNAFFKVTEEYAALGNTVNYLTDYQVKAKEVSAKDLPELQKQAKLLTEFNTGKFQVFEARMAKPEFLGLSYRELDSVNLMAEIAKTGRDLISQKTVDTVSNEACNMMISTPVIAPFVGQVPQKLAAKLEGLLIVDNKSKGVKLCLARVLFAKGEFARSLALYQAEPALKDDSLYLKELAWARFYTGDIDGALRDMARYRANQNKLVNSGVRGLDLSSEIALLQRTGKPISKEIRENVADISNAPWPHPLLAMQLGQISEDDLFKIVAALPGDAQEISANDAWYFIGQKRLSLQDDIGAKIAFEWLKKNGIRSSAEYRQALSELKRLEPLDANYEQGMTALYKEDYATAVTKLRLSAITGFTKARYELGEAYYYGNYDGEIRKNLSQALHWFGLAAADGHADAQNFIGAMYDNAEGVEKNEKTALAYFMKAADQGDRNAQYNLAERYYEGRVVPKDREKAMVLYLAAAAQGQAAAQAKLAEIYVYGEGVEVDYKQAFRWAYLAAMQKDEDGMLRLGFHYAYGLGVATDGKIALQWLKIPADRGRSEAALGMADLYRNGVGVEKNINAAIKWYELSANKGETRAMLALGWIYREGGGVAIDMKVARIWYEQAILKGNSYGMAALGVMYRDGDGVAIDMAKSIDLMEKSAELGSAYGQAEIGYMYQNGIGLKKDAIQAAKYYRLSALQGNTYAQSQIGGMLNFGQGIEKDLTEAASWYQKAADQGSNFAQNNLGDMYENGAGVARDYNKAIALYQQAANAGYFMGFVSLASLYEKGIGLKPDPFLAYTYLQIAASMEESKKPRRDAAAKFLNVDEIKEADAIAAGWKKGMPLPTH